MSGWQDSAERIGKLIEDWLTPMVEDAQAAREERKKANTIREMTGDDSAPLPSPLLAAMFAGPPLHPAFAFTLDGSEAVMRSDGAVLMYGENGWFQHSALPGTPAAREQEPPT